MATRKKTLAVDLQSDGRPVRDLPSPQKIGPRSLGRHLLPQIPHEAPSKIRHTALPPRGSRITLASPRHRSRASETFQKFQSLVPARHPETAESGHSA
jgi:hypothetical protein